MITFPSKEKSKYAYDLGDKIKPLEPLSACMNMTYDAAPPKPEQQEPKPDYPPYGQP